MVHTFEAIIDENGAVELLDPIKLPARRRAFVTVLEDAPAASLRWWLISMLRCRKTF